MTPVTTRGRPLHRVDARRRQGTRHSTAQPPTLFDGADGESTVQVAACQDRSWPTPVSASRTRRWRRAAARHLTGSWSGVGSGCSATPMRRACCAAGRWNRATARRRRRSAGAAGTAGRRSAERWGTARVCWAAQAEQSRRLTPSRKVRTSQGRVVGNADPGKPAGKCHRNDTA
jgi:hypothetical protein